MLQMTSAETSVPHLLLDKLVTRIQAGDTADARLLRAVATRVWPLLTTSEIEDLAGLIECLDDGGMAAPEAIAETLEIAAAAIRRARPLRLSLAV